ncbi:ubiquitin-conjugating enzyme E2 U-like [Ptychodera flava]|uniref:ubiquitin-conjugating enzyme E2 U-like n=1 Tax=Ptychodera flava TaxID=63121 RepID=UPI00396A9DD6
MHCRAYMLLENQYKLLQKEPVWGIDIQVVNDNFFEWNVKISGLKDTIWEGGIFTVLLKFTEDYDAVPPKVIFHTIPFHPNIDMTTGQPCIDFLDDIKTWDKKYGVQFIVLSLQNLLSNPVLESAINDDAAYLFTKKPSKYRDLVLQCVAASKRYHSGMSLHTEDEKLYGKDTGVTREEVSVPTTRRLFRISFDDYYTTWRGIATSKPNADMKNPLLEAIKGDVTLQTAHYGLPIEDLQVQMKKQLQEHNSLMYGNFAPRLSPQELQSKKVEQLHKMKRIYFQKKPPERGGAPPPSSAQSEQGEPATEEPWEKEVDDLVEWTNKLDEQQI